ncbi:hypothetical protein DICPUDRAFT_153140 [Dictyostelium purpureum]|uniref:AAA+ ATPase domain-containing protein n=1 Tax=Dictyostelium purpureum TaxID=5786 RepID=F0ZN53_DICPU|nr:uncharacterized protein DICPUDRAFT_153140 [Dictyostelium purpureum]EGC34633.1 hypothetical protein DICPUDRAFT_153140 [Dictyostelium purpureum]|eukprot:XP_003288858.1 hypothetical protein DICPUDRAFT_153140 [Dictyostelium purpureum]
MEVDMAEKNKEIDQFKSDLERRQFESLPWVEKYRPKSINDLIAHDDIIATKSNTLPHLLFYGPPGTGKTSTIQAIARKLYGENYSRMVLELNASDDRGIDVVREQIKTFASSMFFFNSTVPYKLIILDEADSMTNIAQTALRRVIEKYTKTTRFCIVCNYVVKIIPALQSRCTRFRFKPLPDSATEERLKEILKIENVQIDEEGMKAVLFLGDGDMRKSLNILQSVSMSTNGLIGEEQIYKCTGNPSPTDFHMVLEWLFNEDFQTAFNNITDLKKKKGLSLTDIISYFPHFLMEMDDMPSILLCKALSHLSDIEFNLSNGASEKLQLGSLVGSFQILKDDIALHGNNK